MGKVTHGMTGTKIYIVWRNMLARCMNPNSTGYTYYGARGITVCENWLTFEGFYAWAKDGHRDGLSLDRCSNELGYSSDNCRWVSRQEQMQNRRVRGRYLGVYKRGPKWRARVHWESEDVSLGTYDTPEEAAKARDKFVIEHYDKCATLNFPL